MVNLEALNLTWAIWQFKSADKERRRIWKKLARLIHNRVQLVDAVQTLVDRRRRAHGKSDPAVVAMEHWLRHLKNGRKLSESIAQWVPERECMLIAAGERGGSLYEALESVADSLIALKAVKKAIWSGLAYPILLIVASFGILGLFGFKLIPEFSKVIPEEKWTGLAAATIQVAHWVQHWLWVPGVLLLLGSGALVWSLPNWTGPMRSTMDKYAPFNLYRIVEGSSWIASLASLVEAGERLENAIKSLAVNGSPWLVSRTNGILRGLRNGLNLGEAMLKAGHGFPDTEIIDDIAIYSSLSGLDEALKMVAKEWINSSVESIQSGMALVFNLGIVCCGSIIGFMVMGLISMQMQMGQLLQAAR